MTHLTSQPIKKAKAGAAPPPPDLPPRSRWRRFRRPDLAWFGRDRGVYLLLVMLFSFVPPPIQPVSDIEAWRLGGIERIGSAGTRSPVMGRSIVAAEDANFCLHWEFDMAAIRDAMGSGANRGASTLTQQVAKNVFLWRGRSWLRKAMEAGLTPVVRLFWSKQRILEVYLNNAEFAEGVFGDAGGSAALFRHRCPRSDGDTSGAAGSRSARPKGRSASKPGPCAQTGGADHFRQEAIAADGRASCFQSTD